VADYRCGPELAPVLVAGVSAATKRYTFLSVTYQEQELK
jgi:hypothetical protein